MSTDLRLESSPAPPAGTGLDRFRSAGARYAARAGILVPFLLLFLVLSLTSEPFATKTNLLLILEQQSSALIIAAAMTLVLVSGGIDLSVGAVWGFAGVTSAHFGLEVDPAVAMLLGIGAGTLVGLVNGIVTSVFKINALIATLAMTFIVNGASGLVSNGQLLNLFTKPGFGDLAGSHFLTVKTMIWVMVAAVVVIGLLLSMTTAGRYMYAAGGNAQAARLAGVRVDAVRILAFVISGTAAGLAGVLDTSNGLSASLQLTANDNLTFTVLAGVVIGGTSILGGEGAVWRSVVGVLFIALIDNGWSLLQNDPLWEPIILGALMMAAVALDSFSRGLLRPGAAVKQLVHGLRRGP
jgi:ribose transport system permease protein